MQAQADKMKVSNNEIQIRTVINEIKIAAMTRRSVAYTKVIFKITTKNSVIRIRPTMLMFKIDTEGVRLTTLT